MRVQISSIVLSAIGVGSHRVFSALILVTVFYLPATIALFFAWSIWGANQRPPIASWRLLTFRWALIVASMTTVIFAATSARMLATLQGATGFWLAANWTGAALWVPALVSAFVGKGSSRAVLVLWGVFAFLGIFGTSSAMIP